MQDRAGGRGGGDGVARSHTGNLTAKQLLGHITEGAADAPEPTGPSGVIFNSVGSAPPAATPTSQLFFQLRPKKHPPAREGGGSNPMTECSGYKVFFFFF